jgi:hypothetical protein
MSPSSADRWSACPGSVTLNIGKRSKTERYSAEGTVAHAVLAECLQLMTLPADYLGTKRTQDGFEIEVDQEMVDGVAACLRVIEDWTESRPGWTWMVESELSSKRWPTRGYVDFGLLSPDLKSCLVLDFKYGAGVVVPINDNPQVMTYGAMLLEANDTLDAFSFVVVQPRARTGPTVKTWETDRGRILAWMAEGDEAKARIAEAHSVRTEPAKLLPLLAEGDHCRWCAAKPECPRLQGYAIEAQSIPKTEIREWGAEECRQWLERLDALDGWIDSVRGRAYQLLEEGEPIRGWKLVDAVGHRKWSRPANEIIDVLRDKGFQKKALIEESLVSPAKVEKMKLPKSLSKDGLKELVESLTVRPVGGRKMAKDADPREESQGNSVSDDFAEPPVLGD